MDSASTTHVIELTDDSFDSFLDKHDVVVVAFYLKWIPRYKRFAPAYGEAARLASNTGVPFVQVNCQTQEAINKRYRYTNWPTISILRGPEKIQDLGDLTYSGPLKGKSLTRWVTRQIASTVTLLDAKSLAAFKNASEVVVVGFFAADNQVAHDIFHKVAQTMKSSYLFGIINDESVAGEERVTVPGIALYKDFDERKNVFDFTQDVDVITMRIKTLAQPLVEEFLPETHQVWLNGHIPLGYMFVHGTEPASFESNVITPVAKAFQGRIQFGTVQLPNLNHMAEEAHVDTQHMPAFAIVNPVGMRKFPFRQPPELSRDSIQAFTQDFLDGKLKPVIKSAPIPETQGPVLEIVGDTWDDEVINNDKDVLVEYYTQSCGPCKALLPSYTRLAQTYAADPETRDKVVLAKVDAEENDVDLNIRGFPTFKLFPAGAKDSPVLYDSDRHPSAWAQFIFANGGRKVRVPDTFSCEVRLE